MDVLIIGAGVGGLTLGLMLHEAGIPCRIYEAAPEIKPLGVGINLLPHAMKELSALGLEEVLAARGVLTAEALFFNRFGQLIYQEPLGRAAGYDWPQVSIHRGDLQAALVDAFIARAGADRLMLGWQCTKVEDSGGAATAYFRRMATPEVLPPQRGGAVIACDGIHSVLRKQLYPDEGEPIYSGVNMSTGWWRSRRPNTSAGTGAGRRSSRISSRRWRIGISTGSTCRNSSAAPRSCWNIPWSTRIRCRAGASAASACSAMRRTQCIRAARTGRARQSSMRARSPIASPPAAMPSPR